MGKKTKLGKSRRDKAYWSAKEIGYRSRASFKLVQLNRKFEFLQKSRVCIDLCAAPGSWMQVAKEHMPMSSLIVGVDLVPIKPIPGCISMINDITTEKCRSDLRKELKTWKADLVIHDGAPNVGKSWVHDAYNQSLLTLSAFKLATEFLMKGGTFVTKVFRSKDYQSLMWVFNQFFKRVHSTKPAASRHESAEIFVVCQNYKAPDKIDPKFLDGKYVFSEIENGGGEGEGEDGVDELVNPEKKKKKTPAEGYESGVTLLFKQAKASEFIMGDKAIHLLNNCHEIVLDEARIRKHPKTTVEIVECCKDIKVLGMKELRALKKWREALRKDFEERDQKKGKDQHDEDEKGEDGQNGQESDSESDEDLKKLEDEIVTLKDEERRVLKRKKKKEQKEKVKRAQRINLEMIHPGDEGPTRQETSLFKLSKLKSKTDLDTVMEQAPDLLAEDSDSDQELPKKKKYERFDPDHKVLDKDGLYYKDSDQDSEDEKGEESDSDQEDLGLGEDADKEVDEEAIEEMNDGSKNSLLVDLNGKQDRKSRKEMKADVWFDKDVFKGIEEDDDLEEADVEAAIDTIKKKGGKLPEKKQAKKSKTVKAAAAPVKEGESSDDESTDDSSEDESDFDENEHYPYRKQKTAKKASGEKDGFEVVPVAKPKKRPMLSPEELALGQELVSSKKRRRELEEIAWNRYMFNDPDENLPDWFVKEEQYHMRKLPEVDPKAVEYYKDKQNDIGVKTIKKVVEAKARKKRKIAKKMEKAKKKAAHILENEDLGSREKGKEIQRLYKKAQSAGKKPEVKYVVAKKATAQKRAKRPTGLKGLYKQVDPRMKKDNTLKRTRATSKRIQKRKLKGKKTRPQQQESR